MSTQESQPEMESKTDHNNAPEATKMSPDIVAYSTDLIKSIMRIREESFGKESPVSSAPGTKQEVYVSPTGEEHQQTSPIGYPKPQQFTGIDPLQRSKTGARKRARTLRDTPQGLKLSVST